VVGHLVLQSYMGISVLDLHVLSYGFPVIASRHTKFVMHLSALL
jgi:hypothetical protein